MALVGTLYGLSWNKSTDTYARLGSAIGKTAGADFNSFGPYGLKRCNLTDGGAVTASYGDRCYTDNDVANMGMAMVQIPKFYYYTDYAANVYRWYVTTDPTATVDGNAVKLHPAFSRNSVTKSYVYLGAYEAYYNSVTTKLESKAGVAPTGSKTIVQFRTAAEARGTGWEQQDYLTICAIQLLYLIEYGGFNSQALLGKGITSTTGSHNTGETSGYGSASYGTQANAATAVSYRGIENPYGNLLKCVDGVNIKADYGVWVADHGFASDTYASPYVNTSLAPYHGDLYPVDITTNSTYDYGFLGSTAGGSTSTYIPDDQDFVAGNRILVQGGTYVAAGDAGLFDWYGGYASTGSYAYLLSRLMYIG